MEIETQERIVVTERSQVAAVRQAARRLAYACGMAEAEEHTVGIVATELASNLVKHTAGSGEMLLRIDRLGAQAAIEMVSIDRGPGIADIGRAMFDGHSTSGSAGTGLGAVRRLSTLFDIYSQREHGTVVLARAGRGERQAFVDTGFTCGVVSVPVTGEHVSGDGVALRAAPGRITVLVVDGLGHGAGAREAAAAAIEAFAAAPRGEDPGSATLHLIHDAARPTRGVAAAVMDLRRSASAVTFAGMGNIAGLVLDDGVRRQVVSSNGTLGQEFRTVKDYSYPWSANALVILHTDGLISHWSLDPYPGLGARQPAVIAAVLYRDFSRQRDDVTVFVARETA
jgi:anti-sigma regulatory factor (Ser/Thr protein kinase)